MDIYELHKKIKLVLDEEKRAYTARGRTPHSTGSLNVGFQSLPNQGWTEVGHIPAILFDESVKDAVKSSNAELLLRLFSTLDQKGKDDLKLFLFGNLHWSSEYADIAYFIFFVLYRVGAITDAAEQVCRALVYDSQGKYQKQYDIILGILSAIISHEYLEIDLKTYEALELWFKNNLGYDLHLRDQINLAKLKHLEVELRDVNPEINSDRDKVVELWDRQFRDPVVPNMVAEIEDYFRAGEFTNTKFATCIGRIRVLLVETARQIAAGIHAKKGSADIPGTDDKRFFEYLKSSGHISAPEWNILRSLYDLASNDGAHASVAPREYARLVRNMTYEVVLLLLSKHSL